MNRLIHRIVCLKKPVVAIVMGLLALATSHSVTAVNLTQSPLFMTKPVTPIMMLNVSNDHQLFFKLYNDYSDLDGDLPGGDPGPETTYKNSFTYYGYFNSDYCYSYSGGVFARGSEASGHLCTEGGWSGNFLNWATMTRVDAVRKLLYGGKRSIDTTNRTVLERAYIPSDAHAFAKYYNGPDLQDLTDGISGTEATFCNVTKPSGTDPLMRVVEGNYSLWGASERFQCLLVSEMSKPSWANWGDNDNDPGKSGLNAQKSSPSNARDYIVKVEVCGSASNDNNLERCVEYGSSLKPTGVLNTYGEDGQIHFGLISGSYKKNKSGGVLRKNASSFVDEINPANGTHTGVTPGIIATVNAFAIQDYNGNTDNGNGRGMYNNCGDGYLYGKTNEFQDGTCVNWGNPQSEIYFESLRYLAGQTTPLYHVADDYGLVAADWVDPVTDENSCAPLSVLQFSASTSSYDGDGITGTSDIGLSNLDDVTDAVGHGELSGGKYFVGNNGAAGNSLDSQLCTPKTITNLSAVEGICPDAGRLEGTYHIAGLAFHALTEGINTDRERVVTYAVELAPPVPEIKAGSATILPACRRTDNVPLTNVHTNCGLVDFKVIENTGTYGKYYINWEDTEQGGDFDQDAWGILEYELDGNEVIVRTDVVAESTPNIMGFGYVISGTDDDGFHVHSGVHGYVYGEGGNVYGCEGGCNVGDSMTEKRHTINAATSGDVLKSPLYYAAKWGGFDAEEHATPPPGEPSNYYLAVRPQELEEGLRTIFQGVADMAGARASISTNSTRLQENSMVFQALFNSNGWWGDVKATSITDSGGIGAVAWQASKELPSPGNRNILTYNGSNLVDFVWGNLTNDQQTALIDGDADDAIGPLRVAWLRGESLSNAALRQRKPDLNGDISLLGDIVDSDPVFFGDKDYRYSKLNNHGGSSYSAYVTAKKAKTPIVYVQANDGKLHAFNANNGAEVFAFVPPAVFDKLADITRPDYGRYGNAHIYTANGQVTVGDVYLGGSWRTYLVAAYGEGAEGVYVLDVTDPVSPTFIGHLDTADIGHVLGKPAIVPLPSGSDWAIVFGNGYHTSGSHSAKLIAVPLSNGSLGDVMVFDTGASGDNGLAEPEFSMRGDGAVNNAYAGDLLGSMWRFDMSQAGGNTSNAVTELFNTGGQPITAPPTLGLNPEKRVNSIATTMVYFGTGRYLSTNDIITTNTNSFYAVADVNSTLDREDLVANTMSAAGGVRTVLEAQAGDTVGGYNGEGAEFDWASEDVKGWYVDFPVAGERVVDKAHLIFDRLIFPTVVPTENACDYGGKSWLMDLTAIGSFYRNNEPMLDHQGMESDSLSSLSNLILIDSETGVIVKQNSDGSIESLDATLPAGASGRQSWRQIQ